MSDHNTETDNLINNPNQLTGPQQEAAIDAESWSIAERGADREVRPYATQDASRDDKAERQKITYSNLRVQQISNLRTATAPRDKNLDKTASLPREARLGKPLPPAKNDTVEFAKKQMKQGTTNPHPWQRLWARVIDGFVTAIIASAPPVVTTACYTLMGARSGMELALIFSYLVALPMVLLYEPFCICLYGTTVGKALFHIKIFDARTGSHLTFMQSLKRYFWMLWYCGQLLAVVPIVGTFAPLVGHIMQYKKLVRDKATSYDEKLYITYLHQAW